MSMYSPSSTTCICGPLCRYPYCCASRRKFLNGFGTGAEPPAVALRQRGGRGGNRLLNPILERQMLRVKNRVRLLLGRNSQDRTSEAFIGWKGDFAPG
jgi:hypothetical protein